MVQCDWENGYVECSAMFNTNVTTVFKELLNQARSGLLPLPTFPLPDRSQEGVNITPEIQKGGF